MAWCVGHQLYIDGLGGWNLFVKFFDGVGSLLSTHWTYLVKRCNKLLNDW